MSNALSSNQFRLEFPDHLTITSVTQSLISNRSPHDSRSCGVKARHEKPEAADSGRQVPIERMYRRDDPQAKAAGGLSLCSAVELGARLPDRRNKVYSLRFGFTQGASSSRTQLSADRAFCGHGCGRENQGLLSMFAMQAVIVT